MEAARDPEFLPHDGPLREDVRRLGALVGQMLAEQGGQPFFERVEHVRTASIHRRRSGAAVDALAASLTGLDAADAEALARAFATYFQAVNTAERVHRIRRRRDYQREGGAPQPESLAAVLASLKKDGVTREELSRLLDRLDVEPVFTAHPTEAVRRSLLEKEQEIVRALVDEFDPTRTPQERRDDDARILMALSAGWQTAEASPVRPSVQDEFDHVGFYISRPIYRVLPALYESMQQAIADTYGEEVVIPRLLRFATWVGGDMDGNPNVNADTIAATLAAQRSLVLERYVEDVVALGRLLSQTQDRVTLDDRLQRRIEDYRERLPDAAARIRPRHGDMPYRAFLTFVAARLSATLDEGEEAYASADEFIDDIALVEKSLLGHSGRHAGAYAVARLLWRARTFGFHLARLDVRQDARVHDEALAALLDDADWANRDTAARVKTLRPYAAGERSFVAGDDHEAAGMLRAVFATLADARQRYGHEATGLYIISMAETAADVLAVLALARRGGLLADGRVPLDVAPLFETIDDLRGGAETLQALLDDPVYRAHLKARGDRQWIMLGYSDSGKDGGTVASRWSLQRAQVELLEVATKAGIRVAFFHGRGGSASRGGSRITPALMASPRGSVAGVLRVTEQGEVIHRKYGIRALAVRNLEQTLGAVMRASLRPRDAEAREAAWKDTMARLSDESRKAYRAFVDTEGFVDYFRGATPIDVIERMTLGSRPARRRSMKGVEDLRAIPWVFSWTQCRAVLTGWYGLGAALDAVAEGCGEETLVRMAREWPFFSTMLDDVEMVLAKADIDIAEAFSELAGPLHDRFFPMIRAEFDRTVRWVLKLKGASELLAGDPRLATSIRLRNPYVDPMSLLQVDLLRRWRATGGKDDALLKALVACVNGVSQGLQNTG
ncbi:Phosphoenolpyruvate carboxylase, type 1 [Luteibacter sp. UNCMF331Sha3.1]|uniref:phosphoenolpyruvate carboxylase n=1 Tax=Luteibacter sp. UNCMF331Sha3.1 TaxID=1502760 RepID=UPI0008BE586A|nr:phosphoenolpyruvate carboxylase [Luteibacter sp. UNCMF331Sha3.1]SEM39307.1 Phosphoenolpyruvate carboxylase, type 1 [Luteibacter sp. UNCMF331Sha3.1]